MGASRDLFGWSFVSASAMRKLISVHADLPFSATICSIVKLTCFPALLNTTDPTCK